MKGASVESRKNNQMLKQVQHDMFGPGIFVIPNLIRDLGFGFREFRF